MQSSCNGPLTISARNFCFHANRSILWLRAKSLSRKWYTGRAISGIRYCRFEMEDSRSLRLRDPDQEQGSVRRPPSLAQSHVSI
jgi:hypothetical protein